MRTNDLIAVMEREAALLTDDNWHAAAAVMREALERVRSLRDELQWFVSRAPAIQAKFDLHGPADTAEAMKRAFARSRAALDCGPDQIEAKK